MDHWSTSMTATLSRLSLALILVLPFAGCSSQASRDAERERYRDFAEEPVDSFSFLGRFHSWHLLGKNELVVWTAMNKAYLLTVDGFCPELSSATTIGLTSTGGRVSRGFDSVTLPQDQRCTITQIQPIDVKSLKQAESEAREAGKDSR